MFNDNNQRVATINDLLITDDGRVDQVVLAVRRMGGSAIAEVTLTVTPGPGVSWFALSWTARHWIVVPPVASGNHE